MQCKIKWTKDTILPHTCFRPEEHTGNHHCTCGAIEGVSLMLTTILASPSKNEGGNVSIRIVMREQDEKELNNLHRFMTQIDVHISTGQFHVAGHYDMTAEEAYKDFLNRCLVEGIALEGL